MTYKENITAILECYFTGFKEEIIDSACNRILEQESCEDAISRQAAIDGLNSINGTAELDKAFEVIENLPSVQPKRLYDNCGTTKAQLEKTGHWRKVSKEKYVQHAMCYFRCSECDELVLGKSDYCPHCGKKMEVGE